MIEEGYDLVIRVDPAPDASLVGRRFLHDRLVVVAGPDMPHPEGAIVPVVVRGSDASQRWAMTNSEATSTFAVDQVLRMSSLIMIRDAVLAGAGAARLPLSLVSRDIVRGRLSHWGDVAGSGIALWALYPSRRLLSARVSAFLNLLKQSFPQAAPEELAAYLDR